MLRQQRIELSAGERQAMRQAVSSLAAVGDAACLLRHGNGVWPELRCAAAAVAQALPARVAATVAALADDSLDVAVIEGEPERDDLPDTTVGLERRFAGGLWSDWFSLAYAALVGLGAEHDVGLDQVGLE